MTSNKHYERFVSILSKIEENGISTADELRLPKNANLSNELYFATQNFINYFALASKTGKTKTGKIVPGNADKVKFLIENGGMDLYDIQMDILLHIMKKLDHILAQSPVSKKVFYTYRIVNNKVNDLWRKLPPVEVVPWDTPINSDINENGAVLADIIGDSTYDPDAILLAKETVGERIAKSNAEQAKKRAEKKKVIFHEIELLRKRPAEVMVRLAVTHLSMKPRQLASLILDKGPDLAYAEILLEIAKRNDIELSEIRDMIAGRKLTPESVKADTNDHDQVASQVSRISYRANHRLDKDE